MLIGINEFVKRQTAESKFSHFEGTWEELVALIEQADIEKDSRPGYRDGVMLVSVPPDRFRTSVVKVDGETPLEATFGARQEGEESHLGIVARGGEKQRAKRVDIVLYAKSVLEETGEATGPEPWQVISINASPTEEEVPFAPVARARNILQMEGGTDAKLEEKTREELIALVQDMARATIFHSQHVMVEPLAAEEVEVSPYMVETDGKGGGKVRTIIADPDGPGHSRKQDTEADRIFSATLDGLESLLLALACEGVKVGRPQFRRAVETATDAIRNNAD